MLLILLKRGLVDALDINIAVASHYGRPLGLNSDKLVVFNQNSKKSLNYHLSTVSHPDIVEKFNRYLVNHSDDILALKTKYKVVLE